MWACVCTHTRVDPPAYPERSTEIQNDLGTTRSRALVHLRTPPARTRARHARARAPTHAHTHVQVPKIAIQAAALTSSDQMPPWYAKKRKGTRASPDELVPQPLEP